MSAAALWCSQLDDPPIPQLSWRGGGDDTGVERHQLRLRDGDITGIGGRPVSTLIRTLSDVTRLCSFEDAVVAGDQLLRRGITDDEVDQLRTGPRLRGHQRMLRVLDALDRRSTNPFETLTRLMLVEDDVGQIECQVEFRGHFYDFHLVELDAFAESDGFEFHKDRPEYRRDRRVLMNAAGRGITLLRFTWEDVMGDRQGCMADVRWVAMAFRDRHLRC